MSNWAMGHYCPNQDSDWIRWADERLPVCICGWKPPSPSDDYCPGHCGFCDDKHRRWEQQVEDLLEQIRGYRQTIAGLQGSYEAAADRAVYLEGELKSASASICKLQDEIPEPTSPSVAREIAYNAIQDLRMYMSVAEIKNPLLMIDEYVASRGMYGQ